MQIWSHVDGIGVMKDVAIQIQRHVSASEILSSVFILNRDDRK